MPNSEKPKIETSFDLPDVESLAVAFPEIKQGDSKELKLENAEGDAGEIEGLKAKIERAFADGQPPEAKPDETMSHKERIEEYQEEYLPEYLKDKPGLVSSAIKTLLTRGSKFETEGREKLPKKGPFIVICNHFGNGDTEAVMKTFKDFDLHFAVGKEWADWDRPGIIPAAKRWFFKKLGMIPVEESLSNLTPQEKEDALSRQDKTGKKVFRKIIDREKSGLPGGNMKFVQEAIATLSRGDTLCVFPEGPFLNPHGPMNMMEKEEMKQGYRGIEIIARWYQELTGEQLPIIPTAFTVDKATGNKKLSIGESLLLEDNDSGLNGTDWCMSHVAKLLPEEQRGYYKDVAIK